MSKRHSKRPSLEQVALIKAERLATQARLFWGKDDEVRLNRGGELHLKQRQRIKKISIFDPWLRLLFGGFFVVFAATQRFGAWQFWLPALIAIFPLVSAVNGLLAGRRLATARVDILEGTVDEVRPHRSEAVAATLHRSGLYMFLLNYDGAGAVPAPNTPYRFYVVFDVIRPGIVVAIEQLGAASAAAPVDQ